MAQLVEQRIRNAWVAGSSPAIGSFLSSGVRTSAFWLFLFPSSTSGISSVGRALASQAEGRGFESRIPLTAQPPERGKRKNKARVKKVCKIFGSFKKTPYLCTRNQGDNPTVEAETSFWKDG